MHQEQKLTLYNEIKCTHVPAFPIYFTLHVNALKLGVFFTKEISRVPSPLKPTYLHTELFIRRWWILPC